MTLDAYRPGRFGWGVASRARLAGAHPVLVEIADAALYHSPMDFSVVAGWRGEADQNGAFANGKSKVRWPNSRHNNVATQEDVIDGWAQAVGQQLSMALDVAPFIDGRAQFGNDRLREIVWLNGLFMGVGLPIAISHGFYLRTGADWNMDGRQREERFSDLFHVELRLLRF